MLNGIDPIVIFQFRRLVPVQAAETVKIPLLPIAAHESNWIEEPPIPIYLSQQLTGMNIDTEDKNVDIDTDTQAIVSTTPGTDVSQKPIGSVLTINLLARKDSIGLSVLSALMDLVYDNVTCRGYHVSYLHGATTIFRGLIHGYSVSANANDELLKIKIEISRGSSKKDTKVETPKKTGETPLS